VLFIKSVIVRISDDDHQKLKIKVAQNKTSTQEVLSKIIKLYINDDKRIEKILQNT